MLKLRSSSTGGSVGIYLRFKCSNWIIPFAGQPDGGFWSGKKIYFILLDGTVKVISVTDVLDIVHCLRLKNPLSFGDWMTHWTSLQCPKYQSSLLQYTIIKILLKLKYKS
jgi:hypothetical protein